MPRLSRALTAAFLALVSPLARAQSSFESDPFASRFRERANFDLKFKAPEKGGVIRIEVPPGEGGRQSLEAGNVGEAVAPPGEFVTVTYQDIKLKARRVRADYQKRTVVAEGDVFFEQGASHLSGARLDLDLDDKIGVLTDGRVDLAAGIHLTGALLSKVGPRSFTLSEGTLTACEGARPAWIFTVGHGRVTLDDYARLHDVVFRLGGVPLLWTPYLVWPALRDRASGFLIPGVGYNSNRGGYLGVSYFWAIDRSWDATFSADGYTKGYYGLGAELRARPSNGTKAEGTYYTIWDPVASRWRWQTRGALTSDDLAPGLRAVVGWLDFSDLNFFQDFNRDFSLVSARSVKSEAFLTYGRDPFSFNLRLDREEALFGEATVISERRPVLEARMRPTPFFAQRVFFEMTAQAGALRVANQVPEGSTQAPKPTGLYGRFDLFPKLAVPLSAIPWLSLEGTLGARVTSYGRSMEPGATALSDASYTRKYVQAGLELTGPSFSRIFEASVGEYTKLKHVLEPRLDWDYLPDPGDLSRTPLFDEVDFITPAHTLRYGLVQRLLAKGKGGSRELASLEISRRYYFTLPGLGTPGAFSTLSKHSPVDAALRVNAGTNLNFDARTTWDASANQITSASVTANVNAAERTLALSLFDSRPVGAPSSAQIRVFGGTPIVPKRLRLDVQANYDLSEGRMLESRWLLTFEGSCFKILTEYRDLRIGGVPSRDYRIALNLKNVGSFLDFTGSLSK